MTVVHSLSHSLEQGQVRNIRKPLSLTHTHEVSRTHQQQSRRQRLADRWSLSNRQKTKNMVAFLHSLREQAHAQTHTHTQTLSVVLQQGLSTFKKPTFLNPSQYSCGVSSTIILPTHSETGNCYWSLSHWEKKKEFGPSKRLAGAMAMCKSCQTLKHWPRSWRVQA